MSADTDFKFKLNYTWGGEGGGLRLLAISTPTSEKVHYGTKPRILTSLAACILPTSLSLESFR